MAAEETVQALTALTVIGGVAFVLLMIFNINSYRVLVPPQGGPIPLERLDGLPSVSGEIF
jgi:hypothetical protein